jgi:septation ring formation regulator EzrA
MSKTLEQLKQQREELNKQSEDLQIKSAEHQFEIKLDSRADIKTITEHLNKGYTWKTQYRETEAGEEATVRLRGHELNGLYQALLNVEGTGIENARRFIKMLTNVGSAVTDAMKELSDMNQEIGQLHQQLSELDQEIDTLENANTEQVEPELEVVGNETEK